MSQIVDVDVWLRTSGDGSAKRQGVPDVVSAPPLAAMDGRHQPSPAGRAEDTGPEKAEVGDIFKGMTVMVTASAHGS